MKICWDNLEKLIYRQDRKDWQNKINKVNFCWSLDNLQPLWANENRSKWAIFGNNRRIKNV
jgi:hypothetical protein